MKWAWFSEMCLYNYRFQNTSSNQGNRTATFELGSGGFESFQFADFHLHVFADNPGPVGFHLLNQLTIVCRLQVFGLKPPKTPVGTDKSNDLDHFAK